MSKKSSPVIRDPLTDEELWFLSADDFVRLKLSDDEKSRLRTINRQKELEREDRGQRLSEEEAGLVAQLREAGCAVESVWDLVNTSDRYSEAIPILLDHLRRPYSDRTRSGIARSLAVRDRQVQEAWSTLAEQYRQEGWGKGRVAPGDVRDYELGAKAGLACALSVAVTDANLDDLIRLILDPSHGPSRLLLLSALRRRRSKSAKVADIIVQLSVDPQFSKEIASWRTR